MINLNDNTPAWKPGTNMHFPRRQHNATVLPDGTVLVTGGTSGIGGDPPGFSDETGAVHQAELWNPDTKQWTLMAAENTDRCYHSTALLLPDGRVLSAGGGEGANNKLHTDAQIYKPPYLFKGSRPKISNAPSAIHYNSTFDVTVDASDSIKKVSWVRLGSVTHSTNMNQSLILLQFTQQGAKVTVTAPLNRNVAPPGHYMLFLLNQHGVPAVAPIIHIGLASTSASSMTAALATEPTSLDKHVEPSLPALNQKIIAEQKEKYMPPIVIGITSTCPYGLGPCWGGAYDALRRINDIAVVRPIPDHTHSLAFVYPHQDILPDIDKWRSEFEKTANQSYHIRGIEMTLTGVVTRKHAGAKEQLVLARAPSGSEVALAPFQESSNIRWDLAAKAISPISNSEAGEYERLFALTADHPAGLTVKATGSLQKHGNDEFSLDLREFEVGYTATASL
jgi:hypothetical protein